MNTHNLFSLASLMRDKDISLARNFMRNGDNPLQHDNFTYFVTAHFSKSKQIDAEHHAKHFRNVLDRKLCGRGKHLYKMLFIEEGSEHSFNERHAHWIFEKPNDMTAKQFIVLFKNTWKEICGSDDVVFKRITQKAGGIGGLLEYLTKERDCGDGNIGRQSFVTECSDNARYHKYRESADNSMFWHQQDIIKKRQR